MSETNQETILDLTAKKFVKFFCFVFINKQYHLSISDFAKVS